MNTAREDGHHFEGRIYVQPEKFIEPKKPRKQKVVKVEPVEKVIQPRVRRMAWEFSTVNMEEFIEMHDNVKALKIAIKQQVFDLIQNGYLDVLPIQIGYWSVIKKRFVKADGEKKHYDFIRLSVGYGSHCPSITLKYRGFFIAQSNHTINTGAGTILVPEGSYIIKLGNENIQTT